MVPPGLRLPQLLLPLALSLVVACGGGPPAAPAAAEGPAVPTAAAPGHSHPVPALGAALGSALGSMGAPRLAELLGLTAGAPAGPTPTAPELCGRPGDEDGDGLINCADPDCWGAACAEDCGSSGDEDGDGLDGCEDADCAASCLEDCEDGSDNDADGDADCADTDCALRLGCWSAVELRPVGGADLRLRVSSWRGSWVSSASEVTQSVTLDALEIAGLVASPAGGTLPCAAQATGPRFWGRLHYAHPTGGTDSYFFSHTMSAGALTAVSGPCPAPTAASVEALGYETEIEVNPWSIPSVALSRVAGLSLRRSPAVSTGFAPAGVRLGDLRSVVTSDFIGSAPASAPHSFVRSSRGWSRSQTARAESMVEVGP